MSDASRDAADPPGELLASPAFVRALIDGADDGIFMVDPEGLFLFVNEFIARSSGLPKEAFVGRHFLELIREQDRAMTRLQFERVLGGEQVPPFELAYHAASSEEVHVEISAARVESAGVLVGAVAISRNIQKRKHMEQQLRDGEEKYRSLLEALPYMVSIIQGGRVVFANDAMRERFPPERLSRDLSLYAAPGLRKQARTFIGKRLAGEAAPTSYQTVLVDVRGVEFPVEIHAKPMQYRGEPAIQYVVMDLSERRALEAQLHRAQKLEAIGVLAGGVAHEFNNMLTAILATADMWRHRYPVDTSDHRAADLIYRAARQSAGLTQQLLGFARKSRPERKRVDLTRLVDDVCELMRPTLADGVQVVKELDEQAAHVLGDPGQLQQVLMNLIVNAKGAMPSGGQLSIRTERAALDDESLLDAFSLDPGEYLRLTIEDAGVGIPEEIRERIFEPFFTTKPHGEGSGMGLSVVYGIVRAHSGAISIESRVGHGTIVSVYLRPAELPLEKAPSQGRRMSGQGAVLLIDDEPLVRESARRLLDSLGYEAISCGDGSEAIRRFREERQRIVVAVIDVKMPGMDGWACLEALREIDPGLPAIMTSGHGRGGSEPSETTEHEFLAKPYDLESLGDAVARQIATRDE